MKITKQQTQLFDAITDIDTKYITQAVNTKDRFSGTLIRRIAVTAATVAILVGVGFLIKNADLHKESVSFLAVRAYAADGTMATLENKGDQTSIASGTDPLFPGKETYTLDVSLRDYTGDPADFGNGTFFFLHKGKLLEPGESDEYLKIDWYEHDGFYGYRITGWCEEFDLIRIKIQDEDNRIIHQKFLTITKGDGYCVSVSSSFTFQANLSTEELLDQVLSQDYSYTLTLASSPTAAYSFLVNGYGGFAELETRFDAPTLLMDRYVRSMNGEEMYNEWIIGLMLSRDIYWEKLSQEQKEMFASYGMWRNLDSPDQDKTIFDIYFPGKEIFEYEVLFNGKNNCGYEITVQYGGHTVSGKDEHVMVYDVVSAAWAKEPVFGWKICGWFDEDTVLSIIVTDTNGKIIRQEDIRISHENGYQYEVLTP